MPFVENDDFTSLVNWDTNGELINGELVHHIPAGSDEDTTILSTFNGVHLPGDAAWSISIGYRVDTADILLRGYDPVILSFKLNEVEPVFRFYELRIVGADVGQTSGDIRTELKSTYSALPNTNWVYSAILSGTITFSHDGSGGLTISGAGYFSEVFPGVIPTDSLLELVLKSNITNNTWDEINVAFDVLSSTGGVATPDPPVEIVPIEGALKCGFGLKSILGGLSTNGAYLACGLAIGVEMTGGRENLTANLLVALGIDCSISGNQPTKCIMKAGICLTCLMRAESVPQNVLQHAFALGLEMKAGQSGQGELASGLFIGCKMGGSTGAGAYPCLSRDFSHMSWF